MSEEISVAKVMDLKGLACPMPIVKVSKGIKDVQVGEVLQAVTSMVMLKRIDRAIQLSASVLSLRNGIGINSHSFLRRDVTSCERLF